jgi:hypothetical protein
MTTTPPRRNWHLSRWLLVFTIAALGWSGWRAHNFRLALAEAEALGWSVLYRPYQDDSVGLEGVVKERHVAGRRVFRQYPGERRI